MGDTVVSVYYRPPDQEEEVDELFHRQLKVDSGSQALILMVDLNYSKIWREKKQSTTVQHFQAHTEQWNRLSRDTESEDI